MKLAILISTILLAACAQTPLSKAPLKNKPPDNEVMCTMDAMQCADGSWVGRSPPNCEFKCPAAAADQ